MRWFVFWPQRGSEAGGLGQEVQHQPHVSVLVVDGVQLAQQLLGPGLLAVHHLRGGLKFAPVAPHEAGQVPAAGAEEIHQRHDGCDHVDHEEGHGDNQDVEVELGGDAGTLVPGAVHVTEHPNIVILEVGDVIDIDVRHVPCLPVDELPEAKQWHPEEEHESKEKLKNILCNISGEHRGLMFETLPHLDYIQLLFIITICPIFIFLLGKQRVESLQLLFVFEKFVRKFLDAEEDEGGDEEDVGEVDGELAHGLVGAECLDIPHVVPWVIRRRGPGPTLTILGAGIATGSRNYL